MGVTFSRSMRSLERERFAATRWTLPIMVVLGSGWLAWFLAGSIGRYTVTDVARLEAEGQAHPVVALTTGVVVASYLTLGQEVARGQLLVELESVDMQFDLVSLQARKAGLTHQLESQRREIRAQEQALREAGLAGTAALEEAHARVQEAEAAAAVAERQAARMQEVFTYGHVSEAERDVARGEARQRQAAAAAVRASLKRLDLDRQLYQSEKRATLAHVTREGEIIETELTSLEASAARLEHDRQHSFIVAPVPGRLAEIVPLQAGAVVHDGDRLGVVIPAGRLRVVAEFPVGQAVGRIREGQTARLRLMSFPWIQYGALRATVTRVATEGAVGSVRVELTVLNAPSFPAPLEHGLTGTLEVEVERVSPATLVLRAVGRRLDRATVEQPGRRDRVSNR